MNNQKEELEKSLQTIPISEVKYCLYARKSMEAEERQAMSIDSQITEMKKVAERDNLYIAAVRTEAHSAKNSGERPEFNKILEDIANGKYNGILTWNPDRLSRNAGDLGRLVDLMDKKLLSDIRTYGQRFSNSPNEKFLLMILGSQAKLENDNRSINVKRGLRALCERGRWSGAPPMGYLTDDRKDQCGVLRPDPTRAHVIKMIFGKAIDGWSQRKISNWLNNELHFLSPKGNNLSISTIQLILRRPFYYGEFEYPKNSGKWYKGSHQPIITKELFDAAAKAIDGRKRMFAIFRRNFAFTKFMKCGLCGSGICGEEKFKVLKDGSIAKYVYYGCARSKDKYCKFLYMREADLIEQLRNLVDKLTLEDLGVKGQFDTEVERIYRFHRDVMGEPGGYKNEEERKADTKKYVKYLLAEGTIEEKRHVLLSLRSKLILKDKKVYLETLPDEAELHN